MRFVKSVKCLTLLALIPACAMLQACAGKSEDAERLEDMTISVDFRDEHRCSRISPEITVAYAPVGTRFYDVRLIENGAAERYLGGGGWQDDDGSGIIPEGALTRHYTGPCPPKDRRVEYTYIVAAMEDPESQPLKVRLYKFIPE